MFVILGATGHIGRAAVEALLAEGREVVAVVHDAAKADDLRAKGAEIAEVDVHDVKALRDALRRGRRALLLNPPADPSTDTDVEERGTAAAIVAALEGSGLERVVAISTYGAEPGERLGDLSVLFEFEQALKAQPIPLCIQQGAYYMSNWDAQLDTVRRDGVLHTLFPIDFELAMVAPADLGVAAARLLTQDHPPVMQCVEGPERHTAQDVAAAFAKALGREVRAEAIPREHWRDSFKAQGFSEAAADTFARMADAAETADVPDPDEAVHGPTTLQAYIDALVKR